MLSILLLALAAPQSVIPPMPPAPPPAPAPEAQASMRVLGAPLPGCASSVTRADDPNARNGLLWREGQDAVGHYLLLDRYVAGCADPIMVNRRVPGSNAVGREVGRAPAAPVVAPRR